MRRAAWSLAVLAAAAAGCAVGSVGWIIDRAIQAAWRDRLPDWDDDTLSSPPTFDLHADQWQNHGSPNAASATRGTWTVVRWLADDPCDGGTLPAAH